jgi:hypothetical protein
MVVKNKIHQKIKCRMSVVELNPSSDNNYLADSSLGSLLSRACPAAAWSYTVLIASIICLIKVHPAKQARAQVAGNVSGLSCTSLDP